MALDWGEAGLPASNSHRGFEWFSFCMTGKVVQYHNNNISELGNGLRWTMVDG